MAYTTADKLQAIIDSKEAIRLAINSKGGSVSVDEPLANYATRLTEDIIGPSIVPWEPNPNWPDLKAIIDADTESYIGKVAVLYEDSLDSSDFGLSDMQAQAVRTSDGSIYTADAIHTWNRTQDIDDGSGIKKRWVIFYYSSSENTNITFPYIVTYGNPIWVVIGSDGTGFTWNYSATWSLAGNPEPIIQSIEVHNGGIYKYASTSATQVFASCTLLQKIPLIDTSQVTDMNNMFSDCASLQTIPLLDTSQVTDMNNMFNGCNSLQTIPLLDTSQVTDMNNMFNGCNSLQTIPLLDTSQVTDMSYMFFFCNSLQTIPLLDTSQVTDMSRMFYYCYSLQTIPLLDTSQVTNMSRMFYFCSSLQAIPLLDTSQVTNMSSMFYSCSSLQTTPVIDTSQVTDMTSMLDGCARVQHVNFNVPASVTLIDDLFDNCVNLWNVAEVNLSLIIATNRIDIDTFDFGSNTKRENIISFTPNTISLGFAITTSLTYDSLISLISGLVDLTALPTQNIQIGATNIAKLSTTELDQITAKNWTYS